MKRSLKSTCLVLLAAAAAPLSPVMANQDIGYIEEFALAAERGEALKQLIPGTEDYYYYHALHFQNTGQAGEYAAMLSQWEKRFRNSGPRDQVKRRQLLLDYAGNPKQALDGLRRELGLSFNHQQEGRAQAREYPSKLDAQEISWQRFLEDALRNNRTIDQLTDEGLFPLLKSGRKLTPEQRRSLLSRADLPDLPGLVALIAEDLKSKESKGFGEFKIHRNLTTAQLDALQKAIPDLLRNENFVHTRLARLQPGADTNAAVDPAARAAYLDAAWKFVSGLAPSFNSLKAHVLYQRLVHDRARGAMNAARLLSYVKLPRNVSYIRPEWRREAEADWKHAADCGRDYRPVTGMAPIGGDEPLVRDYLLHLLKDAKNFDPYAPYIAESWLKAVFAETKIVNGIGDPEQWASLLSPSAFQALKDRVDVDFDPGHGAGQPSANVLQLGIKDPVHLRLHVKNVGKLIVKVFEINTLNYYRDHGRELSTDLQLDGLVANHERSFEYDDAPVRRVARDFAFPEIGNRRGVWVVEFIGGSRSSRAIVRKGRLSTLVATGAGGANVQLLDETRGPVSNGALWIGERRIAADAKGRVVVPFSNEPGQRSIVLEDADGFASLGGFGHPAEQYQLHAGFHVAREALRPGSLATLAVRPTLTVAGQPVSLKRLEDVRLVLSSTDLDGVTSTDKIPDFRIESDREATHEFRVPDRLAALQVQLLARVVVASQGKRQVEISASERFLVNGQLKSERVDDLYLSRIDGGYVVELLGRTGEVRTGHNLNVGFRRAGFKNTRKLTLKTDGLGGVALGALDGITAISVSAPDGHTRSWELTGARRTQAGVIQAVAGNAVRIAYPGSLERSKVALLAVSRGGHTADLFGSLQLKDGALTAKLPAGDYRLYLKESRDAVTIRVAAGPTAAGHVFNAARILELDDRAPARLAGTTLDKKALEIRVANADALTRVHLVATRFLPDHDVFANLGFAPGPGLYSGRPAYLPNLYLSGRKIGDEFRYILERRYGKKLPGNMLERPEILLNPWAVRDTKAGVESLEKGEAYKRADPGAAAGGESFFGKRARPKKDGEEGSPRTVDFLAHAPTQLLNLRPDKDGRIRLDLAALGDRQHVHILVVDPDGASYGQVSLPDRETAIRDLRLANALDPNKHFTEQDSVTLLKAGDQLVIPDLLTGRLETFDHLGAAYRYLLALRDDATLREFAFITSWDQLKPGEKRAKYSKHACHELSFFMAMKDPEFFKSTVVPHLANKKDRTFLDDYLLGNDLQAYFAPHEYERLNVPERILLARRHPGRLDGIRLDLRDRLALTPPDLGRDSFLFDGALASFGLSSARNRERDMLLKEAEAMIVEDAPLADLAPGAPAVAGKPMAARSLSRKKGAAKSEKKQELQEIAKELSDAKRRYEIRKDSDGDDAFGEDLSLRLGEIETLYRALESTKEWAENNYYHLPIGRHTYSLITENKFWLDLAKHEGAGFGSRHLGEASRSFHEMMMALAVLDLPFTAPKHETRIDGTRLEFTSGGNAIAFHREIKEAALAEDRPPLLVSQAFFRQDDRYRMENGEKTDKFVTDEFVAGVVYGGQVVVTNPTSSRQKLDVLLQIPKGSLPVLGHRATATKRIAMEPYTTQRFEVQFYFPAPGEFPTYPAHVSKTGEVVAHAGPFTFKVVDKLSKVDETSWAHISQWGTPGQVLDYLATRNLHAIELGKIAWRCREDAGFMKKALAALDLRGIYHPDLYSYGILHNHAPAARQFLLVQGKFLSSCGLYLGSELVTIDPINRRAYQHLEYKPLVNNRAHQVGEDPKILNDRIRGQYQQFMTVLSQKATLDDEDQLSVVYYLFLQDRAGEALARLAMVDPRKLPTRIQYDYFRAYGAFYQSDPATARKIADQYAEYPVEPWRERFANVIAQADEIEGRGPEVINDENRDQVQARLAAQESTLDMEVEGTTVKLDYRNLAEVTVNYYEMDLEFLFSTNPFVSSGSGGFAIVRPNQSATVKLPKGRNAHRFALPAEYQAKNVLVEVIGAGKKRSRAVYANELRTSLSENFGILTVRHTKGDKPLSKVYVKVYALTGSGPKFYKDGYTDLRGKFDYASVSTSDIRDTRKFSILVMSENQGATVLEAPVPQR